MEDLVGNALNITANHSKALLVFEGAMEVG